MLVTVVLLSLTAWLAVLLQRDSNARRSADIALDALQLQGRANQYVLRRTEALRAVQAFFLTTDQMTPARFDLFVNTV
ncbi:MAG TPA: hypothetical protein V6D47_12840, partial [Oscillatoriaceae cyanobacterium]